MPSSGAIGTACDQDTGCVQYPPGLGDQSARMVRCTQDLHQQYGIERRIPERQALAVGLCEQCVILMRRTASRREDAQHPKRQIGPDVAVAGCHERRTDPPRSGTEVEQERSPGAPDGTEHRTADGPRNIVRKGTQPVETGGKRVVNRHRGYRC